MTEPPEPTREEEDAPLERRQDEDAQRYPAHEDPERVIDPDPDAPKDTPRAQSPGRVFAGQCVRLQTPMKRRCTPAERTCPGLKAWAVAV